MKKTKKELQSQVRNLEIKNRQAFLAVYDEFNGNSVSACTYESKQVEKGGITCPECLKRIKLIKSIKL